MLYYGHSFGSFPNETSITPYPDTADEYRSAVRAGEYRTHTSGVEEPLSEGDMQTAHTPPFITSCNQLHHCFPNCSIPLARRSHGAMGKEHKGWIWSSGGTRCREYSRKVELPASIIERTIQYMTSLVPRPTLTACFLALYTTNPTCIHVYIQQITFSIERFFYLLVRCWDGW